MLLCDWRSVLATRATLSGNTMIQLSLIARPTGRLTTVVFATASRVNS